MPHLRASMRTIVTIISALAIAVGLLLVPSATNAVPVAPTGLSPNGTSTNGIPVLSWTPMAATTSYDVQVARSSAFSSPVWTVNTVNHQATPTVQLDKGEVWWRVRARKGAEIGEWATATVLRDELAGPLLTSPGDATELRQPDELPALGWEPVLGAHAYTIQVSIDEDFTDPTLIKSYTTSGTSFVLTELGVPNTYHWRVRADLGSSVTTEWSNVWSYKILGLALPDPWQPQAPRHEAGNDFTYVQDAVLDWHPVPGASTYDLQVSTDQNFNTIVDSRSKITGTSYARPTTLNNDQYYWRVRPVDASGNTLDWAAVPVWKFGRNWPTQPLLVYPDNDATVGDPFYYEWTGIKHASSYQLLVSAYPTFEVPPGGIPNMTCTTTNTTWTPTQGDCQPAAEGTYYWRVKGVDSPGSVVTDITLGVTPVHRFTYSPERVTLLAPQHDASTRLPVLTWEPLPLAARYRVKITNVTTGSTVVNAVTLALSYTPRAVLAGGQYRWQVIPIAQSGREGAELLPGSQPRFTVTTAEPAASATPEPDVTEASTTGGAYARFPTLRWASVTNATRYRVLIRPTGGSSYTALADSFAYPAGEDSTALYLTPRSYQWRVEAYQGSTFLSISAGSGTFEIVSPAAVAGHEVAITGSAFTGAAGSVVDTCDATLPSSCQNLRQTPVLRWDASPDAGYYKVYLSRDPELTNLVKPPFDVYNTMWASATALADSQAGSAYFWEVVPCTSGVCSPPAHAAHAFNKLSNPVQAISPGVPVSTPQEPRPELSDDITLTWEDYLATNGDATQGTSALAVPSRIEAKQYRVQTSTDPAFMTILEAAVVDQTSFTSYATTYPEGPIYWRVQAIDGSDNSLEWSRVLTFLKRSPTPALSFPKEGQAVHGQQRFEWTALPFAAAYDIEVYRQQGATNTRVVNASTKQISFAAASPLPTGATYTWHVRRSDAVGRKGAWSDFATFTVIGEAPTLQSPATDATLPPSGALFTWRPVDGARSYRFERRLTGGATIAETIDTAALAWAPKAALPGSPGQWRVSSVDAAGTLISSSAWRDFVVNNTPSAVTGVAIEGSGQTGSQLTVTPPVWDVEHVSTAYQWLRDGARISGALAESYVVSASDVGKAITVRATGSRTGYASGVSISNSVTGTLGPTVTPAEPPSISGDPRAGQVLTATPGSWPGSPRLSYQWLRNGVPIDGADDPTYGVQAADAGRQLRVNVTGTISGYEPGTATSAPVTVRKLTTRTVATLAAKTVRATQRATMSVRVSSPFLASPLGPVKLYAGRKVVATLRLKEAHGGAISGRLPRLRKGIYKVKAVYGGSVATTPSTSRVLTLKVTR